MIESPNDFGIDDLDDENGPTLDDEAMVTCPNCGESTSLALDPGGGPNQEYVEDCNVCCSPFTVRVRYEADGIASVMVDETD